MSNNKVWYVTGASQGLGLSLVKQLLAAGYRVAATSRSATGLQKSAGTTRPDQFLPLGVDLTSPDSIRNSIEQTIAAFGAVDVVVNNAGYGMEGTVEEMEEEEVRAIFEINVLATINVTKYVLPYLRKQRSGHIINISSVAGFAGAPGWSIYSATKSAVIAFSEVLALDVQELGIKVTVIGPSGFRTGFLTKNSLVSVESQIADYQSVTSTHLRYAASDGKQDGDPEKAAAVFIRIAESPDPPLHLWLGANAFDRASEKIASLGEEIKKWKDLSLSAEFITHKK
ncbi:SDR family NAD(P)-dependent oxidoreductase [Flavitalea sp. BT771]|uniref:SDR family NAD(P)-dependent oxidoreductase n=1 Tax=Flavitalea sp. BT771 TaxID=3063329 RepID=UPI0026E3C6A2|nr:SDR family NAD(P)-dependent oxidoreductase [Flavitalea sp. BT771]MDO6429579.1 SDR family NAD(P)-dependent oxidoreductase [Flavitalea sp. BT771]MDV6218293.1 SDR family NAD(P)-dependent oxidoreductase [Flavitalea sp. BT771]